MSRRSAHGTEVTRLLRDYRPMLLRFLPHHAEEVRAEAYELGRSAFARGVPLLAVCRIHQEVTGELLRATSLEDVVRVHEDAGELLLEVLAAYEMTHRAASER